MQASILIKITSLRLLDFVLFQNDFVDVVLLKQKVLKD